MRNKGFQGWKKGKEIDPQFVTKGCDLEVPNNPKRYSLRVQHEFGPCVDLGYEPEFCFKPNQNVVRIPLRGRNPCAVKQKKDECE